MRSRAALLLVVAVSVLRPSAAAGQETEARDVEIAFDTGDFDAEAGDWGVTIVHVSGDLEEGLPFTVELYDANGVVVWSGTDEFAAPTTSVTVSQFVAVADVAEAGISQALPEVAGELDQRQPVEVQRQGAGGGGGGALALSLVLAVVLVAILFRTPLPAAMSQRWTK